MRVQFEQLSCFFFNTQLKIPIGPKIIGMGRYVPPHRRVEPEADAESTADDDSANEAVPVAQQRAAWDALSRSIISIFNRLNEKNVEEIAVELFRENIVRGRGLVVSTAMRMQHLNPELTPALVSLLTQINARSPAIIGLLCRRLVVEWTQAYRRKDWLRVESVNKFFAWLYIFQVVGVSILFEILLALLTSEKRSDEDIHLAAKLFQDSFRALSARSRREFHTEVLQIFRDLLAMDDPAQRLSTRAQAVLERCLQDVAAWEKVKDHEPFIPSHLVVFDLDEQTQHEVELNSNYPTERGLDRFQEDPNYAENEAAYERIRRAVLGDNWELEMLEGQVGDDEEESDEEKGDDTAGNERPNQSAAEENKAAEMDANKVLLDVNEKQIRRDVYLAMRSSVRADEAVHKLLKHLQPGNERVVCFMVIEGCCEEKTYRRIYEMSAERLCKTKVVFQTHFVEGFHQRYAEAETLSMKQIEYTCNLFAHLLRTESVYWGTCLSVMNIAHNNTSQRLLIQFLLRSLAGSMSMANLMQRIYKDREVLAKASWLFPLEERDEGVIERAINLFVSMELGELTGPLREELERRRESRKRARE